MSARQLLDRVQSLAACDALAADAAGYAAELAAELPAADSLAGLEARDAALIEGLYAIDDLATRVMRIRLDRDLQDDTALAPPTRRVFVSTVVSYASDLDRLATRVRDVAARGGAADPGRIAATVVDAARFALGLRDALRGGVLATIRELATATVPLADGRARDRSLDESQRKRWSAARRDAETIAEDPARITAAPLAARLAAWPEQLDEPDPGPEVTFADMIELD